jgi:hypothetical protein
VGLQKNHHSILLALKLFLIMDLLQMKQLAGALCSNDAKSCYD